MEENISLKDKIKEFFMDDKKRLIFILSVVIIIIVASIIIAIIFTKDKKDNESTTTSKITTTEKVFNEEKEFRGFKVVELTDKDYTLDLKSRHGVVYSDNKLDYIHTTIDDVDYNYEVTLVNGTLQFKELKYDKEYNGEVYTGKTFNLKLSKKITDFIIGHNCTNNEYTVVVLDESKNIYTYENRIDSNKNIEEIIESFTKFKTISTPKKIGVYKYDNEPFMECPLSTVLYTDKNNNIRVLDEKNTLFYNTLYYRYIGDDSKGEVIYVFKDKTMAYSTKEDLLNYNNMKLEYKGSFYIDSKIYIIDSNNHLYMVDKIDENTSPNLKPVSNKKIIKIGSREAKENKNKVSINTIKIEFEDESLLSFEDAFEYEILG